MARMLTVSQLSKSYAGRTLFSDASFQVGPRNRLGLIGANGAGKTTLFSLILGENEPDAGTVSFQRGTQIGYLPQESAPTGDVTVLQLATSVDAEIEELHQIIRNHPEEHEESLLAQARLAEREWHHLEAKARRILAGLAFRESDLQRPAKELSGGWIMRAHLARLLVMEPPLLLLDEPTNHLDLETLGWFQNRLQSMQSALLVISHDREFLNAVCNGILEIRHAQLHRYNGNYDDYLTEKKAREDQHRAAYENQQREIARLQSFVDRFRAKASKAAQAQERLKMLAKMERIAPPESEDARVRFRFPQPERSGHRVLQLSAVDQSYGDIEVYRDLNLTLERGERTVLVGPNGAGKSTLLKICAGLVPLSSGERLPGHNVNIGYFAQQRLEVLDPGRTVLQESLAGVSGVSEQDVRSLLGAFLFRGEDVFKSVSVLSGGEKSRLALAKLLLNPPNLLLLDEPTTHLDLPGIDALAAALANYSGTLMFVSHDVHFIRKLAGKVIHIDSGRLTVYPGNFDYYVEKSAPASAREGLVARLENHQPEVADRVPSTRGPGLKEVRAQRKAEAEARKEREKQAREHRKRLAALEAEVLRLEQQQSALAARLEEPTQDSGSLFTLNRELATIEEQLQAATEAWEKAVDETSPTA